MSDGTEARTQQADKRSRVRKLLLGSLAVAGGVVLLLWSFVLPILGIIHVVEMLS
jgi:hypothetical protein